MAEFCLSCFNDINSQSAYGISKIWAFDKRDCVHRGESQSNGIIQAAPFAPLFLSKKQKKNIYIRIARGFQYSLFLR